MIKNTLPLIALSLTLVTPCYAEQNSQSHDSIYELVKQTLIKNIKADDYEINVLPLDNLLRLPECAQPLTAAMTSDVINPGRTTVGVRCDKGAKWSIFTSAMVKIFDQVFILTQPIQLGEMLSPQHLTLEKRDVSNLRGDFVTRIEQLENKKSTRYLPKGSIISLKYFVEPFLVKRGERVTISAIKSTFNIDMKGIDDKASKLGAASLPAGKVRIFIQGAGANAESATAFLGEDWGKFTPIDDEMRLYLGVAQDIVVQRTIERRDQTRVAGNLYNREIIIKYEVENFKPQPVTLDVAESISFVRNEIFGDNGREIQWELGPQTTFQGGPDAEKSSIDKVLFHAPLPAKSADGKAIKTILKLHLILKNEW